MSGFIAEGSVSANLLKFEDAIVSYGNFENPVQDYPYLPDPTPVDVKKGIFSALESLFLRVQQDVLVLYWAATKSGNAYLLTTTDQPYGRYGNDKGLELYRKRSLQNKHYIHIDYKNVVFGLPGYAFQSGTCFKTQYLHRWLGDQHPPREAAVFEQIWGAFAVPVILDAKCYGVLEVVMNTPKDSYDNYIYEVYKALESVDWKSAGSFQSSTYIDPPRKTFTPPPRGRITESSKYNNYDCLVQYMGLSSKEAIRCVTKRYKIRWPAENTFRKAHQHAGIPEWPWVPGTESRASSSAPELSEADGSIETSTPIASTYEAQLYQRPLKSTSPVADDFNQYWVGGVSEMSLEQTPTIFHAFEVELDEMGEDQDDPVIHDQGRYSEIYRGLEECISTALLVPWR